MKTFRQKTAVGVLSCVLWLAACGGDGEVSIIGFPRAVAVDSENERMVVLETGPRLNVFDTVNNERFVDHALISDDRNKDLRDNLATSPRAMVAAAIGTDTRFFVAGQVENNAGVMVGNRIQVFDTDGETTVVADISPIDLDDSHDPTDETDDVVGDMAIDRARDLLCVSDVSNGLIFFFSTEDGSQVTAPVDVGGSPRGLAVADGKLYVANSTETAAEQLISQIDLDTFAVATLDLDEPTDRVAVVANDVGTVLFAKVSDESKILIRTLDPDTLAAAAIAAGEDGLTDGQISAEAGINGVVYSMLAVKNTNDNIYLYANQNNGTIIELEVAVDLTEFVQNNIGTTQLGQTAMAALIDDDGVGERVYSASTSNGSVVFIAVGAGSSTTIN